MAEGALPSLGALFTSAVAVAVTVAVAEAEVPVAGVATAEEPGLTTRVTSGSTWAVPPDRAPRAYARTTAKATTAAPP
jgi:hypothetical protein